MDKNMSGSFQKIISDKKLTIMTIKLVINYFDCRLLSTMSTNRCSPTTTPHGSPAESKHKQEVQRQQKKSFSHTYIQTNLKLILKAFKEVFLIKIVKSYL